MSDRNREDDLLALGRALRQLRRQQGLSQEQLAERVGIHAGYISRIERGHRGIQWLTLRRFLAALETDLQDFVVALERAEHECQ
jgi:transcriptional regulator with XRE-family HTH domain